MKVKSGKQYLFILCCTFLVGATMSCNNQSQSNKENHKVQTKNNIQPIESKIDTIRFKYATGVRSILEDSLGNIWFGTVESGVWRYDGNSVKNFTEKDGLESEHIWIIYKSKQGELWFGGANPSGVYRFNGNSFEKKY